MKFLIETGNESHTSSWQKFQAKFVGGEHDGKYLYQLKSAIVSQERVENDKHRMVMKTVYELPEGTKILLDYKGYEGPEKRVIRLDASQEVKEEEIGTGRLRTYTVKGRYTVQRDLIAEKANALKQSQEEGF